MNWAKSISGYEIAFVLVFLILYIWYLWNVQRATTSIGRASRLRFLKLFLRVTYFGLFITALLGPSFGNVETETKSTAKDIILAIDLSKSMDATDVSPSRLDMVKLGLNQFIDGLSGNRFGLLVFSSEAYWLVPLTYDHGLVKDYINNLRPGIMPDQGTNLTAALEKISQKFESNKDEDRSKVAILITDGEDFGYVNSSLKDSLKKYQGNIFYLGVGTETGGLLTRNGEIITDESGVQALSKLNKSNLQEMAASVTQVFFLDNESKPFPEISQRISSIGQQVIDVRKILVLNNKYTNFLLIALVLAALDALVKIKQFEI
ncbi:vWA domain-containing protein [Jiulongibacter sediminis]|uniref:VWFA domain-containing protein n=1 Tax=Jiulongibacter sediminis TaxID=1605367 RepID=A0A0P7BR53_9BACT|nr:VWA domain-containing protein [Jiulongibacter sediminis]KPM49723.1 hypothetical protein AFM12_03835 [Jiulongibacter sediminis]TBX26760.1 hypothetical protein TK44_03840 [Jiulongibacter sediminis]